MESQKIYFHKFLETAFDNGMYATDDVIAFVMQLFEEVLAPPSPRNARGPATCAPNARRMQATRAAGPRGTRLRIADCGLRIG